MNLFCAIHEAFNKGECERESEKWWEVHIDETPKGIGRRAHCLRSTSDVRSVFRTISVKEVEMRCIEIQRGEGGQHGERVRWWYKSICHVSQRAPNTTSWACWWRTLGTSYIPLHLVWHWCCTLRRRGTVLVLEKSRWTALALEVSGATWLTA